MRLLALFGGMPVIVHTPRKGMSPILPVVAMAPTKMQTVAKNTPLVVPQAPAQRFLSLEPFPPVRRPFDSPSKTVAASLPLRTGSASPRKTAPPKQKKEQKKVVRTLKKPARKGSAKQKPSPPAFRAPTKIELSPVSIDWGSLT